MSQLSAPLKDSRLNNLPRKCLTNFRISKQATKKALKNMISALRRADLSQLSKSTGRLLSSFKEKANIRIAIVRLKSNLNKCLLSLPRKKSTYPALTNLKVVPLITTIFLQKELRDPRDPPKEGKKYSILPANMLCKPKRPMESFIVLTRWSPTRLLLSLRNEIPMCSAPRSSRARLDIGK